MSLKWVKTTPHHTTSRSIDSFAYSLILTRYCTRQNKIQIWCGGDLFQFADIVFLFILRSFVWKRASNTSISRFFLWSTLMLYIQMHKVKGESLNHSHMRKLKIWKFQRNSTYHFKYIHDLLIVFFLVNIAHQSSNNPENGLHGWMNVYNIVYIFKRISANSTTPNLFFFLFYYSRFKQREKTVVLTRNTI